MNIPDVFLWGMKRDLPAMVAPRIDMPVLDLGCGYFPCPQANVALDYPEWDAETYHLPYRDESVGGVFAFHFLEHLTDWPRMLREIQRVLAPGCPLTVVVPHAMATFAWQDASHKAFFVLDSWKNLLHNDYYKRLEGEGWMLRIGLNITIAITEHNTAIMTQLIKRGN
jgi:SAM-dependent methyltransferase